MGDDHSHDESRVSEGLHRHEHAHESQPRHRHPHHHRRTATAPDHTHGTGFESLTYICSPIHDLDARTKIVATLALILAVVAGRPPRAAEFFAVVGLAAVVGLVAHLPLGVILRRSLLVLPFAGTIALFAPLQGDAGSLNVTGFAGAYASGGWVAAWSIISKAWLSALMMLTLAATTSPPALFAGLKRLRMPGVIITLLSFIYRYVDVLRASVTSMRRAIASRGPGVTGWRLVRLYGHLAGSIFIRSYERGERVYAAMVSRGYDGTIPVVEHSRFRTGDALVLTTALLSAAALILY